MLEVVQVAVTRAVPRFLEGAILPQAQRRASGERQHLKAAQPGHPLHGSQKASQPGPRRGEDAQESALRRRQPVEPGQHLCEGAIALDQAPFGIRGLDRRAAGGASLAETTWLRPSRLAW